MNTKQVVTGMAVGWITMLVFGYLIFDLAMGGFYEANTNAVAGLARESTLWWAIALGTLSLATLVTLAVGWSGAKSAGQGFRIGAIVGFLVWFGVNFIFYGNFNISTINIPLVDPLLEIVRTGIGGAVIATVLGRGGEA